VLHQNAQYRHPPQHGHAGTPQATDSPPAYIPSISQTITFGAHDQWALSVALLVDAIMSASKSHNQPFTEVAMDDSLNLTSLFVNTRARLAHAGPRLAYKGLLRAKPRTTETSPHTPTGPLGTTMPTVFTASWPMAESLAQQAASRSSCPLSTPT
jgi:hypothetical protein